MMQIDQSIGRCWRQCSLLLVVLGLFVGCQKEEGIQNYVAPNLQRKDNSTPPEASKERIVGIIAPNGTTNRHGWFFFKLRGPADKVAEQMPNFNAWVDSIRFVQHNDETAKNAIVETVTWNAPPGWVEQSPREGDPRMAVFQIGAATDKLDCGVSEARGSLLDNINRWWHDQLGQPEIGAGELDNMLQFRKIRGRDVFFVDLAGPGSAGKGMMAPHPKIR
jgi:hypothetical protein